ncbi:MAG: hypothetical protein EOO75_09610 [Myxococcales bacterium]|nr:MAG: hypothetical protein EOO75_09610 [Myxococcales bacterium]
MREARPHWNRDFDGEQFSLGRAWYTHLEQGRSQAYFAGARASDALVERFAPGLQAAARGLLSELLGCEVTARRGWCGPGVHVFPAGEAVARAGGVIHSDVEGLSPGHLADRAPALSAVLMLAPPERGGGLRLWDACHHDDSAVDAEALAGVDAATVEYAPGDLVVFDSYRLHQIQAFAGDRDRLSLTIHVARLGPDRWESWF